MGQLLGIKKGIYFKGEETYQNDISAFYSREKISFAGLSKKTNKEAFEYGVLIGLNRGINDHGIKLSEINDEINALLNRMGPIKHKFDKKIVTPYI